MNWQRLDYHMRWEDDFHMYLKKLEEKAGHRTRRYEYGAQKLI